MLCESVRAHNKLAGFAKKDLWENGFRFAGRNEDLLKNRADEFMKDDLQMDSPELRGQMTPHVCGLLHYKLRWELRRLGATYRRLLKENGE